MLIIYLSLLRDKTWKREIGWYPKLVLILDIFHLSYFRISPKLKLLDREGLPLLPQMELAHP